MSKIKKEAEKIYLVSFNSYGDYSKTTVWDNAGNAYIQIPQGGLLVPESKLSYYMKYGNGFESIQLVGSMYQGEV